MMHDKPTAFRDDVPTVQVPVGVDRPGLTVDGEFIRAIALPKEAREAYYTYLKQGGNIRIWQCGTCGYLTDADALKSTTRASYECSGCGNRTASRGLQRSAETSFRKVHGPHIDPGDDRFLDVLAVVPDGKCPEDHDPTIEETGGRFTSTVVNDDAVECEKCVPNHPSHLGRLQNEVGNEITMSEMLHTVAEAMAD